MAFINGMNVLIEFETSTPGVYTSLYCCKEATIDINASLLKVTDTVNGQFDAYIGQSINGTMKTSALARIDGSSSGPYGFQEVANITLGLQKIQVKYQLQDTLGNISYCTAYGFITNLSATATVFSLAETSLSIQLSGAITVS